MGRGAQNGNFAAHGRVRRRRDAQAGFSLVELLAAVFIIALAAGAVALAWPRPDPEARTQARAFAALVERAQQQAVISGRSVGLSLNGEGVTIWARRRGAWSPVVIGANANRSWSEGVGVTLLEPLPETRDDSDISWTGDRIVAAAQVERPRPQLVFDPTGGATAFVLVFSDTKGSYTVAGGLDGDVVVREGAGDGTR